MELAEGQIGKEGKYGVKFEQGKLCAEVDYVGADASAGVVVKIDAANVLDALASAIPGHFDDAILAAAKGLLAGK